MNSIVKQGDIILSFLYDFDILEGERKFQADIDFILNGKRKISAGEVQVLFDTDGHSIIKVFTGLSNVQLPVVLDSRQYTFSYIPGITLQVNGINENPEIGKFRVSIYPKTPPLL